MERASNTGFLSTDKPHLEDDGMQCKGMPMLAVCAGAILLSPAYADQRDRKTIITIDAPLQIPTMTLQPGTYTLKLLDSPSNRHIVTVWDKDGMHLVTTVLAIPNYRLRPAGKSKFSTWETPAGQPAALRAWFYPGDNFGQEFAYPKGKAEQIAALTKEEVPALTTVDESRLAEAKVAPPTEPAAVAAEPVAAFPGSTVRATPVETPAAAAVADPEPAALPGAAEEQGQAPVTMPQTASRWGTITLLGILTAGFACASFRKPRILG